MSRLSRERRQKQQEQRENQSLKQRLNFELKRINPLTKNQELVFKYRNEHQLLYGSAGTGKSFLALYLALEDIIEHDAFKKLVIIRSTVPSREQGFLPGDEKQKSAIYELPYAQICQELFGRGDAYEILKQKGVIEFRSTSYVRGITLSNCTILIDEAQNADRRELDSLLTRVGENSRVILCGDGRQDDLLRKREKSGMAEVIKIIRETGLFSAVEFTCDDIVRSGFVKAYITAAEKLEREGKIQTI